MIPSCDVGPARDQVPLAAPPFHILTDKTGVAPWAEFHRVPGAIIVRFPGYADFAVPSGESAVRCSPVPGVGAATIDHLYFNQVLPLVVGRQPGRLTFHASAVAFATGAVAFMGESRRGKSTLAGAFVSRGCDFLTDDCLIVAESAESYIIEPGHPSLRLWDDSREALSGLDLPVGDTVDYTSKSRLLFPASPGQPRPFAAAFVLGDARTDRVQITPLAGKDALNAWLWNAFVLDIEDGPALARHFDALARLAAKVRVFRVDYPRRFSSLPYVINTIRQYSRGP